jgi:predicted nuclease with TOPRIM domain
MNEEIKRLTMENEALADRIKGLEKRIRLLESEQEENTSVYYVAKAVHEMQNDLKKLHPELMFSNLVYAPDTVGGV